MRGLSQALPSRKTAPAIVAVADSASTDQPAARHPIDLHVVEIGR
jgi:hypothetical protein